MLLIVLYTLADGEDNKSNRMNNNTNNSTPIVRCCTAAAAVSTHEKETDERETEVLRTWTKSYHTLV